MGCLQSKRSLGSNAAATAALVFRVTNVDENGRDLSTGQLQITDSDIILYRQGRDMTLWPLNSLRRYGYEAGIFSFESGRRCETGEGIYAFRCRKAALLFHVLQEQIHQRNVLHEEEQRAARAGSPDPEADNADGSVPQPVLTSIVPPILTGVPPIVHAPGFTPSADSTAPLCPQTPSAIFNTQPGVVKREHNNNQSDLASVSTGPEHVYCNELGTDLNRDLAILRNALHLETEINKWKHIEDETQFLKSIVKGIREKKAEAKNKTKNPASAVRDPAPAVSDTSEHYLQPVTEQLAVQESRMYMNLNISVSKSRAFADMSRNSYSPATPTTPKAVEYCNLNIKPEANTYANLALRDKADSMSSSKHILQCDVSAYNPKVSESDTATSMSPLEDLEVNYAILDIDSNKDSAKSLRELVSPDTSPVSSSKNESTASGSSAARGRLLSQPSVEAPPPCLGYTTIDFDKTVALTSVAAGTDLDSEGSRKTRHNSTNLVCVSPTSVDKNKVFL